MMHNKQLVSEYNYMYNVCTHQYTTTTSSAPSQSLCSIYSLR